MAEERQYLYGFIHTNEEINFGSAGIEQKAVYTIPYGEIAAVVSNSRHIVFNEIPKEILLYHLTAHQIAIEKVMKDYYIIPTKFGTMVQNQEDIKRILEVGYQQINLSFKAMENKIEFDTVVLWNDLASILKEIGEEEEIQKIRAELQSKQADQVHEAKIRLGKMVKRALDQKREQCAGEILDILKKEAEDHQVHGVRDDSMVMNTAFLINRDNEKNFDLRVGQLDRRYKNRLDFRIVGPLPPYSFSTLEIKSTDYDDIEEARRMFDLGEEVTISEIKEAYRKLTIKFHPDRHPNDPAAPKRFERINKAYRILNDYCRGGQAAGRKGSGACITVRPLDWSRTLA